MFTLNPESNPEIDSYIQMFRAIPATIIMSPIQRQIFALYASSFRKNKNAATPPMIPNSIGSKNHALLLDFSGYVIFFYNYFPAIVFFCI